jgi:hypothetical protein
LKKTIVRSCPSCFGSASRTEIDSTKESRPAGRALRFGLPAEPHRLVPAGGGEDPPALDLGAVFEHHPVGAARAGDDPIDSRPQPQLAAEGFEFADEVLENQAHALQRPREPLQKDRAKHHRELAPFHVAFARPPVVEQRAEDHLDQQRIIDDPADDLPGGDLVAHPPEVVVVDQFRQQPPEVVLLARKLAGHLRLEELKIVAEVEADAGKRDRRADLRARG